MTDTDERVTRLLGALATRADEHVAADRMGGVRSRARRAAAVRAGVVVGGVAVAVALVGRAPLLQSERAEPADRVPVVVTSPGLRIDLRQEVALGRSLPRRQPGAIAVFTVRIHGVVPARQVKEVSPSGREHLGGRRIAYGRSYDGTLDGAAPCAPGGPLVRVDDESLATVRFDKAGTYTVTVETSPCPPVGTVRQTITVQAE